MENKLNITKGEWILTKGTFSPEKNIITGEGIVCEVKNIDDGKLIADAGTTFNKCGKLPSQLLEELDYYKELCTKA